MSPKVKQTVDSKKQGRKNQQEPDDTGVEALGSARESGKPVAVIVSGETPKAAKRPTTNVTPPETDDSQDTVVFAFRLSRAERLELHEATGSAKASKFVKAIVLAGARGDMKAIQEIVDEAQASRR
jgi:hypothetical protein